MRVAQSVSRRGQPNAAHRPRVDGWQASGPTAPPPSPRNNPVPGRDRTARERAGRRVPGLRSRLRENGSVILREAQRRNARRLSWRWPSEDRRAAGDDRPRCGAGDRLRTAGRSTNPGDLVSSAARFAEQSGLTDQLEQEVMLPRVVALSVPLIPRYCSWEACAYHGDPHRCLDCVRFAWRSLT